MLTLLHLGHDHATQPHTLQDYALMGLALVAGVALIFVGRAVKRALAQSKTQEQHQ